MKSNLQKQVSVWVNLQFNSFRHGAWVSRGQKTQLQKQSVFLEFTLFRSYAHWFALDVLPIQHEILRDANDLRFHFAPVICCPLTDSVYRSRSHAWTNIFLFISF